MALKKPRRCRNCAKEFPPEANSRLRYCDNSCRKEFMRINRMAAKAEMDVSVPVKDMSQAVTPYVQAARALAFEGMQDEVRETLRAEVREQVKQHLKDNIMGGVEALTALLPMVLVRLGEDVEHPDWMRSSRAQSLILKYVMMFKDTDAAEGDTKNITIIHGVPLPANTPLGQRMADIVIENHENADVVQVLAKQIDPDAPDDMVIELPREEFEEMYPECIDCGDVKPPETFATIDDGNPMMGRCRSCEYKKQVSKEFKKGGAPLPEGPTSTLEQDQ